MNAHDLALLVKAMRQAQKTYFRERTSAALSEAKSRKLAVDVAVTAVLDGPTLFDDVPHPELLRLADDGNPHALGAAS